MPNTGFDPGLGPHSLKYIPTVTVLSATDTNSTTKLVPAMAPLKWGRDQANARGEHALLCAVNDIPELVSTERCERPGAPIGAMMLPLSVAASTPVQSFVLELPISNAPVAGNENAVCADGAGAWKCVAPAAGIGRVLKLVSSTVALVEF